MPPALRTEEGWVAGGTRVGAEPPAPTPFSLLTEL